ncbi:MAG: hypothetical protein JWO19_1393 [Bryobacterales bacterium]|nr:hypothetical protein [Bryobacterales bacterium]
MSTDKASSNTSEFLDSVLRAHQGIERQNAFEEVSASFVTGGGRSDAIPPRFGHRPYPCRCKSRSRIILHCVRSVLAISALSKTESFRTGRRRFWSAASDIDLGDLRDGGLNQQAGGPLAGHDFLER